ncbi:MAG: efflux RND transporter periplasmic adaptor subunit [Pirellulaceae bacterium]
MSQQRDDLVEVGVAESSLNDEGGLRPPDHLRGWRRWWWWFDFLILVKLARLRFIAILVVIGLVITKWDLLVAYYDKWTRPAGAAATADPTSEWFCPMHPTIVRDNPKEKCPICFMPLSKRKKGAAHAEPLGPGVVNRVQLSPYRVVLAGAETTSVQMVALSQSITAVGTVEFNERGQRVVAARVNGRIDKLLVNSTGQLVQANEDLALLYSPDLLVTADNLVQARKRGDEQSVNDATERLRRLGVDNDQIDEIVKSGTAPQQIAIRSPIAGHVIQKNVKEGQYVQEGMTLYEVADLSTVWILAQVYEDDMNLLPLGQAHELTRKEAEKVRVTARTRTFPNEVFEGRLAFVYPHLDENSRTVTIRLELDNPQHKLRPGTTASVTIEIPAQQAPLFTGLAGNDSHGNSSSTKGLLAIPESAVIDTGSQKIVYREAESGLFEGMLVELGPKMKSSEGLTYYPVLKGLSAGDQIVSSGSFLIDAETRLNPAAGSIYFGGSGGGKNDSNVAVRPTTPDDPDAKVKAALAKLSPTDRTLAESQQFCPVLTGSRLGSMGTPIKLTIKGQTVFVCCSGCREEAIKEADRTLMRVKERRSGKTTRKPSKESSEDRKIGEELARLTPADRALAEQQRFCIVLKESRLGSMGIPVKIKVGNETVFLCCEGCEDSAKASPAATLARLKELRAKSKSPESQAEQK